MQISSKQIANVLRAVSEQVRAERTGRASKSDSTAPSGDRTLISGQGSDITRFKNILSRIPDVREDRIAELAEKIASGQYKPSSMDIAEKMLVRELADRLK